MAVPTKEQLEAQLTQLILQRSQMKDQIEQIEKQIPVLQGMVQLLAQQEADKQASED
jgi:phage shock protein A